MLQMTNVGHTVEDSQSVGKSAIAHIYSAIPTNTTFEKSLLYAERGCSEYFLACSL